MSSCEFNPRADKYDSRWRSTRTRGKVVRRLYTDEVKAACGDDCVVYGAITNVTYKILIGLDAKAIKRQRGLKGKQSARDGLSLSELVAVEFAELTTTNLIVSHKIQGRKECIDAAINVARRVEELCIDANRPV